jgi:murein DD-endopeptidase MepM/ murein hydrolase activator NlpD
MKLPRVLLGLLLVLAFFAVSAGGTRQALAQGCGPAVTYVVRPGDNLFRVSLNHGTTYAAVAAANNISNPTRIYPGQVLVMVCASGAAGQPAVNVTQPSTSVILPPPPPPGVVVQVPVIPPSVDCTNFRPTQPLQGFTNTRQVFFWEAAPGATSYRILVYNADLSAGTLVAVQDVPSPTTTASLPFGTDSIGVGFRFSYRIQALVADSVVCSTPLLTMLRAS